MPRIAGRIDHTARAALAQGSKLDLCMFPRLRPYVWPTLAAIAIAGCLYAFSPNFRHASGPQASPYAGDFLQEWIGGWIVRAGEGARLYDLRFAYELQHRESLVGFAWDDDQYLPMVYPPFYYLLVSPLSLLSVQRAAWLWAAMLLAALAGSCWILQREISRRRHDGTTNLLPWLLPAALLFMPVLESLSSSQKGTVCLLLFSATFALWQRGRNFSAGVVFGLLAFKPQLVIVIALAALWKRDWRFVVGGLATGTVLVVLSLLVGRQACADYVRFAFGVGDYMQTTGYDLHKSHTLWGFGKLLAPHNAAAAMNISLAIAGIVGYIVARLLSPLCGTWNTTQPAFRWQFAGLIVATALFCPHLFTYDLTILVLPMAIVVNACLAGTVSASQRRFALLLTLLVFIAPALSTALAEQCGVQLTAPLLIVYLVLIARQANRCGSEDYNSRCGVHNSRTVDVTRGSIAVGDDALTLPSP
jgi:hypothetical protein